MTRAERSARKELRALVARAVAREAGLAEGAARRIANRILRQSDKIADLGEALRAAPAVPRPAPAVAPVEPVVPPPAFDPYEIGAVVTLHRHGAGVLMDRLSTITRVENLKMLAAAQNLAVSPGWATADELRAAIVSCAQQRLAERHAAAS